MVVELMMRLTDWQNSFPNSLAVNQFTPVNTIIEGHDKIDYKKVLLRFGSHCMFFEKITNDNKPRTVGVIALQQSNQQGGYFFMSLVTGCCIHSNQWQALPITQEVIDRIHKLAKAEGQPKMKHNFPIFKYKDNAISFESEEDNYTSKEDDNKTIDTDESTAYDEQSEGEVHDHDIDYHTSNKEDQTNPEIDNMREEYDEHDENEELTSPSNENEDEGSESV